MWKFWADIEKNNIGNERVNSLFVFIILIINMSLNVKYSQVQKEEILSWQELSIMLIPVIILLRLLTLSIGWKKFKKLSVKSSSDNALALYVKIKFEYVSDNIIKSLFYIIAGAIIMANTCNYIIVMPKKPVSIETPVVLMYLSLGLIILFKTVLNEVSMFIRVWLIKPERIKIEGVLKFTYFNIQANNKNLYNKEIEEFECFLNLAKKESIAQNKEQLSKITTPNITAKSQKQRL